jgi:hypothetical protein
VSAPPVLVTVAVHVLVIPFGGASLSLHLPFVQCVGGQLHGYPGSGGPEVDSLPGRVGIRVFEHLQGVGARLDGDLEPLVGAVVV